MHSLKYLTVLLFVALNQSTASFADAAPEPVQDRLEEFEATAARRHIFVA